MTGFAHGYAGIALAFAEYGDYTRGPRVINEESKKEMRKILEEKITKPEFTFAYRITVSVLVILFSTALLVGATNNAFLYFRF